VLNKPQIATQLIEYLEQFIEVDFTKSKKYQGDI